MKDLSFQDGGGPLEIFPPAMNIINNDLDNNNNSINAIMPAVRR
jgi:hypothetical protein